MIIRSAAATPIASQTPLTFNQSLKGFLTGSAKVNITIYLGPHKYHKQILGAFSLLG